MFNFRRIKQFNSSAWVTPEALNVTPDLLGMPLARPFRRVLAISLDALTIALLSSFGALWLLAGIAIASFQLWKLRAQSWKKKFWIWPILLLLLLISGEKALDLVDNYRTPTTVAESAEETDVEKSASATASSEKSDITDQERIENLQHELKVARMPKVLQWRDEIRTWGASVGAQFGWAFMYFTFLPFWWNGQTIGKKVVGLRVVELTGKPLSLINYLGRYGGYAAGVATGMIGFIQILWDANRQAIQDKIAHTVVVDLRQKRRLNPPEMISVEALDEASVQHSNNSKEEKPSRLG